MPGLFSNAAVRVAAAVIGILMIAQPTTVRAETLIDFLWGGSAEYGGSKRKVVSFDPKYAKGKIIVSFGDRRLYHVLSRGKAMSYPIAVPREQSRWEGTTNVSQKRVNPSWRPTPEMLRENPRLPSWVPGGHPQNPLGVRALYLGTSLYRIHGTDAPWTIGKAVSKGCVRMLNEDVIHLYPRVPVGTKVVVTWKRYKTGSGAQYASRDYKPRRTTHRTTYRPKNAIRTTGGSSFASENKPKETAVETAAISKKASTTSTSAKKKKKNGVTKQNAPKEGFFIASDKEVPPDEDMVVRFTRKVGAGSIARSAN